MSDRLFDLAAEPPALSNSAIGTAAELLLTARLLQHGHRVAVPVVDDDGVDLIVNYRTTVQVKTARKRQGRGWRFNLHHTGARPRGQERRPQIQDHVDVLAIYLQPLDMWWHIPTDAVRGRYHVAVYPHGTGALSIYREAWAVYAGGRGGVPLPGMGGEGAPLSLIPTRRRP